MDGGVDLAVCYVVKNLKVHRIEANIQPENEDSKRLAARVVFQLEGFSPRYLKVVGRWRDHERWAICGEDWASNLKVTEKIGFIEANRKKRIQQIQVIVTGP